MNDIKVVVGVESYQLAVGTRCIVFPRKIIYVAIRICAYTGLECGKSKFHKHTWTCVVMILLFWTICNIHKETINIK